MKGLDYFLEILGDHLFAFSGYVVMKLLPKLIEMFLLKENSGLCKSNILLFCLQS